MPNLNKFDLIIFFFFNALDKCRYFICRFNKLAKEGFFKENKVDSVLVFGATNDSWLNRPIGEVKFANRTEEDVKQVLPAY